MSEASKSERDAFKVNSLTGLDRASPVEGEVLWDPARSLWNSGMLLVALILGPLTFSWSALAVFLVAAGVTLCAGHSVGFHRRHRLGLGLGQLRAQHGPRIVQGGLKHRQDLQGVIG